ncbi:hypothetical protein DFR86_09980 [Acidianus sulfidivorans JP7]|uniref:ArnR1-like winged helix-turn-helix domain-containing protein n=1 Tax=Acidianus sulfidivorans JP7 TaxID=619593 RepID=A0A2U9IPC6_9CREN|nr:hypothetical protein [Acidianus sulfidivorans]AWR97837.1 hypothetical protein DFR86_09980 [Acidianus sulfidivorans JP7]
MDSESKVKMSEIKKKIVTLMYKEVGSNGCLSFKDIKDMISVSTDALKLNLNDLVSDGVLRKVKSKYYLTDIGVKIAKDLLSGSS